MAKYGKTAATSAAASVREAPAYDEDFGKRIAGHARQLFNDEVSQRMDRSASELGRLADALRGVASRLDGSFTAPYFDSVASQIERAASAVKDANGRELVDNVQRFARARPLLFLGSAVAIGIGAGRFLKSSATRLAVLPALPSDTRATPQARRSTRKNNQVSQTRGTSHE
jgi:hypothetical protein